MSGSNCVVVVVRQRNAPGRFPGESREYRAQLGEVLLYARYAILDELGLLLAGRNKRDSFKRSVLSRTCCQMKLLAKQKPDIFVDSTYHTLLCERIRSISSSHSSPKYFHELLDMKRDISCKTGNLRSSVLLYTDGDSCLPTDRWW